MLSQGTANGKGMQGGLEYLEGRKLWNRGV